MTTPVICAVNGACVSGGLEIALSCSFVIAAESARFADTHARLGVVATWGLTALLPRAVGIRYAARMSLTGEFVEAAEALRVGLVTEVVSNDYLVAHALRLATQIPGGPAVTDLVQLVRQGENLGLAAALDLETASSLTRAVDLDGFSAAGRSLSVS